VEMKRAELRLGSQEPGIEPDSVSEPSVSMPFTGLSSRRRPIRSDNTAIKRWKDIFNFTEDIFL
jgi:hypothetical protein